jgi:hypothetical protein
LEDREGAISNDPIVTTAKVPGVALEYVRRLRDVRYYESMFEFLAKHYEAAKIDESREGAVTQTLDSAVEPDRRSSPKHSLVGAVAAILGLFGSIIYVLLHEVFLRMRRDPAKGEQFRELTEYFLPKPRAGLERQR